MLESKNGVARVEAFSDGVLAIILTIMVLEMKAPEEPGFAALWLLWPTFFAYVLSYVYIAIYWTNHHRLFSHAQQVTDQLVWSNFALLFSLSIIPFSTALVGRHLTSESATAIYLATLLSPALTYYWLVKVTGRTGVQDDRAQIFYRKSKQKALLAAAIYLIAIPITFISSGIGLTIAGVVAAVWLFPNRPQMSAKGELCGAGNQQ